MSHLDDLKEQLDKAVAAHDFDAAAKLRSEIDSIQHSAKIRGLEETAQAAYFQQRREEEEGLGPAKPAR